MVKLSRILTLIVLCTGSAVADPVRIGLFQKELPQTFSVTSSAGLDIEDSASGRPLMSVPPSETVVLEKDGRQVRILQGSESRSVPGSIRLRPQKAGSRISLSTPRIPERVLEGTLEVAARDRELLAVNEVPGDSYLTAVIAGELPRGWPAEALKTQAVVARTYILKNKERHRADGYDFCDLAHCQVYKGVGTPNTSVAQAVLQTAGELLFFEGKPMEVFFHSACGGHTASVEDVWKSPARPYLRGQSDQDPQSVHAFCRSSPDYRWRLEMKSQELATVLAFTREEGPRLGTLLQFDVLDTASSGWVRRVRARFAGETLDLSGYQFYLLWGRTNRWHELKSGFFTVSKKGDTYLFEGRGLGHGIGLCQWGAAGRARAGADYRHILAQYFPGSQVLDPSK
jgi:stage II sporulation protein D